MTEREMKIGKIKALPGHMESAVAGLSDQQLDTRYRDGGWTIRQVVHHVADSHANAFIRMKLILTEHHPTIKPYDQDSWAAQVDYTTMPVASSLAIIRGLHERWVCLLESVPEPAWTRTANHPERGTVTLDSLLTIYAGHGEKHVEHIMGLRRQRNW
jgi:hypothetical protein